MRTKQPRSTSGEAWEPFDDCAICQAMKEGKASTKTELLEAFAKAKREGKGIVFDGTDVPFFNSHE